MQPRSCEDQQAAYLDGDAEALAHVSDCASCAAQRDGLDEIRAVLGDQATWIEPPASLEERVVAAALGDELSQRRAQRVHRRGLSRPFAFAAAACIASGLVGAGAVELLHRSPSFPQQVALAATPLAPQARAVAHIRSTANGLEIHLDVTGLPTRPPGSFYEAWVKGPNGLVPIGTFHTGNGQITLWSGVPLSSHPTFTVTIQNDNGNATSTGQQVLVGTFSG